MREFVLDLQIHGKYAGGVSKNMEIPILSEQAKLKGIEVLSTGDILHKEWLKHVKQNIIETENGVYADKNQNCNYIIGGEAEDKNGIHHLFYLPAIENALELREKLLPHGNLDCIMCGRPYIKLTPEALAEKIHDSGGIFGPAHSFTPYTGIYAFYDSLKTAYGNMHKELKFIELGLSADTNMADMISENHSYAFLTSSDAHSPWPHRIGREFIKIKMEKPDFKSLKKAFNEREDKLITLNAGLNPKEGKYHCTACSECHKKYSLKEAETLKWKCIKCKTDIKRGVMDRIMMLKDTEQEKHPKFRPPYQYMLPLAEIIQTATNSKGIETKKVQAKWMELVEKFGNEIKILTETPEAELMKEDKEIGEMITAFRKGLVLYIPGGGGKYGKPIICKNEKEFEKISKEMKYETKCPTNNQPQKK
jgi:uncharacterized protein (TIGR00375 family)